MKKEKDKISITKEVLLKIEKGEVKMRSKYIFILKTILIVGLIALFSLFILYLGSLMVFVFKINDMDIFSGMGIQGIKIILNTFPWYLVFLMFLLVFLVEILAKKFSLVYRKPLLYSFVIIVMLMVVGSVFVDATSIHHSFFDLAEEERLPRAMGGMYRYLGNLEMENVHFGTLLDKSKESWLLEIKEGEVVYLNISQRTKGRRKFEEIEEGSEIIVIGERVGKKIEVLGFRGINGRSRKNER